MMLNLVFQFLSMTTALTNHQVHLHHLRDFDLYLVVLHLLEHKLKLNKNKIKFFDFENFEIIDDKTGPYHLWELKHWHVPVNISEKSRQNSI